MPVAKTPRRRPAERRGQRGGGIALHVTLDTEAYEILKRYCPPGTRGSGYFLANLLHQHQGRVEERQRLQVLRQLVEGEEDTHDH